MRDQSTKTEFVRLRAEGRSYDYIAEKLGISKSTCYEWSQELEDQIATLKQEQLNELYDTYQMTKVARIQRLGNNLKRIDTALENVDFSTMAPERLLDFRLKHAEALKKEYVGDMATYRFDENIQPKEIFAMLGDVLRRILSGEITTEQATQAGLVIDRILKTYNVVVMDERIEALESAKGK